MNVVVWGLAKSENCSLPVAVRVSKTCVHKLPMPIILDNWFQTSWRNCAIRLTNWRPFFMRPSCLLIKNFRRHNIDESITGQTHASHKLTIHVSVHLLTMKINQWTRENIRSYCKIVHRCRWLNWTDRESPNMVRSLDCGSWDVVMWAKVPNSFSALTWSSAVTWKISQLQTLSFDGFFSFSLAKRQPHDPQITAYK